MKYTREVLFEALYEACGRLRRFVRDDDNGCPSCPVGKESCNGTRRNLCSSDMADVLLNTAKKVVHDRKDILK
jgi:hypothetical protein